MQTNTRAYTVYIVAKMYVFKVFNKTTKTTRIIYKKKHFDDFVIYFFMYNLIFFNLISLKFIQMSVVVLVVDEMVRDMFVLVNNRK